MPGELGRALDRLRAGGMVVVCDDPDRENEGDVCMAAELVTPEAIAFMACHARGLICLSLPEERCDELRLPLMVPQNRGTDQTAFTVSIDAATGVTTGISAADRARTIRLAADAAAGPADLVRPGHVFPLRARPRGVLERRGQTEAAVDLMRLAGLVPAGVLCEVVNDDGTMARGPNLLAFCRRHSLPLVTVEDIACHLRSRSLTAV
jgi:3,4-dihydroxy 2-butanone 4-phosphate synthase/GTP cyclohydrolase II